MLCLLSYYRITLGLLIPLRPRLYGGPERILHPNLSRIEVEGGYTVLHVYSNKLLAR